MAETSTPLGADPQQSDSAPDPNFVTTSAAPGAVSLDAVREASAEKDSLWFIFGKIFAGACAMGVLATALVGVQRRRRRKWRLQTLYQVTDTPDGSGDTLPSHALVKAPRNLPNNPYLDSEGPNRLGRQIENAAEASLEFGRVLGLVFFDLGDAPADPSSGPALDRAELADSLVSKLRGVLRPTDHVALLADRYIVACIALLPGKTELIRIGDRLRGVGQTSPAFASAFAHQPGLSMYPVCGYRGEELIDFARTDYHVRNSMPVAALPRLSVTLEPASEGNS